MSERRIPKSELEKRMHTPEVQEMVEVKKPEFSRDILRDSRLIEEILDLEHDFLPQDHEVTQYLITRLHEIFPNYKELQIVVADRMHEPNALSIPTGVVMVSKGLLGLVGSQEELDFVLAHEAVHYIQAHSSEINEVIDDAKKVYSIEGSARSARRIAGTQRFSEYEADIRGIQQMAAEGINPIAGRRFFQRLEEYEARINQSGHASEAHGTHLGRMVNIVGVGKLADYTSTTAGQHAIPQFVRDYVKTSSSRSFDQKLESMPPISIGPIREVARNAEVRELIEKLRNIFDEQPRERKKQLPHAGGQEWDRYERHIRTEKVALEVVKEKIAEQFPQYLPAQRDVLLQSLVHMSIGISSSDAVGTEYESHTEALIEFEDLKELRNALLVLHPEIYERLGLIIPHFDRVVEFAEEVIVAANENELFDTEEGNFAVDEYIAFATDFLQQMQKLSESRSFQPLEPEKMASMLFEQATLCIDTKNDEEHLVRVVRGFQKAGIQIDYYKIMSILDKQNHTKDCEVAKTEIREMWYEEEPHMKTWQESIFPLILEQEKQAKVYAGTARIDSKSRDQLFDVVARAYNIKTTEDFVELLLKLKQSGVFKKDETFKSSKNIDVFMELEVAYTAEGDGISPDVVFQRRSEMFALCAREDAFPEELESLYFDYLDSGVPLVDYEGKDGAVQSYYKHITKLQKELIALYENEEMDTKLFEEYIYKFSSDAIRTFVPCIDEYSKEEAIVEVGRQLEYCAKYRGEFPNLTDQFILILAQYDFDLHDEKDKDFLYKLINICPDAEVRGALHAHLLGELSEDQFDERLAFLFSDTYTKSSTLHDERKQFVEHEAQTHKELSVTQAKVAESFEDVIDVEKIGTYVQIEQLAARTQRSKKEMFKVFMEMAEDDTEVKQMILRFVSTKDLFEYRDQLDHTAMTSQMFEARNLYDSMVGASDLVRYGAIREFLVGEKGLLNSERDRKWLVNYLFEHFVVEPESEDERVVYNLQKEVQEVMTQEVDPDLLFFALAPFIHKRFMRRDEDGKSIDVVAKEELDSHGIQGTYLYLSVELLQDKWDEISKSYNQYCSGENLKDLEKQYGYGGGTYYKQQVEGLLEKVGVVPEQKEVQALERTNSLAFLVVLAENLGSVGVRFLQVAGQYLDLPDGLQKEIDKVYDSMEGQSKMTAYNTIMREWPQAKDDIEKVVARRGGGSLMTAYECAMKDGTKRIVKVMNPNAQAFIKLTVNSLRVGFQKLTEKYPGKYDIALTALDDIEAWIRDDIQYDRFMECDPVFRDKNSGFTLPGNEYTMHVPMSESIMEDGSDNMFVKVEEYIDGNTLTDSSKFEPEDMQQATQVIVKNYLQQVLSPVSITSKDGQTRNVSLVHADVHPGNFMIFKDGEKKKVAILDRSNYIELDQNDRALIMQLFQGGGSAVDKTLSYLEDAGIIAGRSERFASRLEEAFNSVDDPGKKMSAVLGVCRRSGIKIPLKITLLAKNINGLQDLAKRAGYSSLQEVMFA